MNKFGGSWTEKKINILVKYARAYLQIMKERPYWKLLYFDGFAGSGKISSEKENNIRDIIGAAIRIVSIDDPISFHEYYFVEKKKQYADSLRLYIKEKFPGKSKSVYVVKEDCNKKLLDLSDFLQSPKGKNYKVLAYIDPYGMQLEWNSIKIFKEINGVDLWVLVPTGLGVNRLLKKDGNISDEWLKRLELFLGMQKEEIINRFYEIQTDDTLFGEITRSSKIDNAIEKSAVLYRNRLNEIFNYVSEPFILRNSSGSIMYHYLMASNNSTAHKIANEIIKNYNETE